MQVNTSSKATLAAVGVFDVARAIASGWKAGPKASRERQRLEFSECRGTTPAAHAPDPPFTHSCGCSAGRASPPKVRFNDDSQIHNTQSSTPPRLQIANDAITAGATRPRHTKLTNSERAPRRSRRRPEHVRPRSRLEHKGDIHFFVGGPPIGIVRQLPNRVWNGSQS